MRKSCDARWNRSRSQPGDGRRLRRRLPRPIVVAALLVPLRDELVSTNLALILVLDRRRRGGHRRTWAGCRGRDRRHRLLRLLPDASVPLVPDRQRRRHRDDGLLLFIGLIVGQLDARRPARRQSAAIEGPRSSLGSHRVANLVADGAPVDVIIEQMSAPSSRGCSGCASAGSKCRRSRSSPYEFESRASSATAPITRRLEHRFVGGGFAIPDEGAELPVLGRGTEVGRFVLEPGGPTRASRSRSSSWRSPSPTSSARRSPPPSRRG